MARYDVRTVKQAADGRWLEVLTTLGGVNQDILDRQHHPCPKCGGTDRFRALDDFAKTGAVLCNACFDSKNGDGIAAVQWLTGADFGTALQRIAELLGVKPEKRKKLKPDAHLELQPWNPPEIEKWCSLKAPIHPSALQRLGAKCFRYHKIFDVIGVPVWGPQLDASSPVGWILYRRDGGKLPKKFGSDKEWVKVKLAEGSTKGIVVCLDDWKAIGEQKQLWWKLEGSTDLLAGMSADFPAGCCFFTTANGAKEKPEEWLLESLRDQTVVVCHDQDKPGQEGATWVKLADGKRRKGWCPSLAARCRSVRNLQLPLPMEVTHGPDIRDYFEGGGSVQTLLDRLPASEKFEFERPDKPASDDDEQSDVEEEPSVRAIDDAKELARANLEWYRREHCRHLRYWNGEWFRYKGDHYEILDPEHLRVRVWEFIQNYFERCWRMGQDDRDTVRPVTKQLVDNVIQALKVECLLPPRHKMETWINTDEEERPAGCLSLKNKILSLDRMFDSPDLPEEEYLFDHSKDWFSLHCLPYEFDPKAECPKWLHFLSESLVDPEQINVLKMWFGYLLLPDCSLEKMLFVIGPTRSGKGTILKIMLSLFGESHVTSPTLGGLLGDFTLHGMLGKTIATIPDARLSKRADREAITERLLSLVANDPQDINRKHKSLLTGVRMNMRFTLFSNTLPALIDSTSAMVGRGIYLRMPRSWLGKEDVTLLDQLKEELPGILNWAIAGRYQLQKQRRIPQPEFGAHLVKRMRLMMAPVAQFFLESCHLDDAESSVESDMLFERWCRWAADNSYVNKWSITDFERRVTDAYPNLYTESSEYGPRKFIGVQLKR